MPKYLFRLGGRQAKKEEKVPNQTPREMERLVYLFEMIANYVSSKELIIAMRIRSFHL